MSPLIDKLLFMVDRSQSEPAGYSLYPSQVASNTLFYCTFNVKSAQPLVDGGTLEKMLNITQKLLIDKDGDAPLRSEIYYRTVRGQLGVKGVSLSHQDNLNVKAQGANHHLFTVHGESYNPGQKSWDSKRVLPSPHLQC